MAKGWSFGALTDALKTPAFTEFGTTVGATMQVGAFNIGRTNNPKVTSLDLNTYKFAVGEVLWATKESLSNLPSEMSSLANEVRISCLAIADNDVTLVLSDAANHIYFAVRSGTSSINWVVTGFIQQGGGEGMLKNKVIIGWSGEKTLLQVDGTPMGSLFYEKNPPTAAQTGAYPITGGNLNEEASVSVISNVKSGSTGDTLYSPMLRAALKGRGGDQDFKDGASFLMRVVEQVGTLAFGEILWDGFGSVHSFKFTQQGDIQVDNIIKTGGGASWFDGAGNSYGSVWGGYLSEWLSNQFGARDNSISSVTTTANDAWNRGNDAYTNAVRSCARGGQQFFQGTNNGTGSNWEAPGGCVMTGFNSQVSDGRGMHAYYRQLMVNTVAAGWVGIGDV